MFRPIPSPTRWVSGSFDADVRETDVASSPGRNEEVMSELLVRYEGRLHGLLSREAGGILPFETVEDLAQGVNLRALKEAARFAYRSDEEFLAWLHVLARRYIADRHDYWSAIRRGSGRVLRLTWNDSQGGGDPLAELMPPETRTGPSTFASRREMVVLATRALHRLPPRDRSLVRWMSEGVDLREQAEKLDMTYEAAQRAGLRAVERFRKIFRLIVRQSSG